MELWDLYDSERKPLGRTHVRGEAFGEGEYYVCVEVWIRNSKGEFLIQKRHPAKKAGNQWEFVGGGTLAGETTLQSAVREVAEENGIIAKAHEFTLFATYQRKNYFQDLFLLRRDVDIRDLVLQPEEAIDARWATEEDILTLIANQEFVYSLGQRFEMYRDTVRQLPEKPTFCDVSDLKSDEIFLRVAGLCEAQPEKQFVPAYHFEICLSDGTKIGKCDLRIGHNDKLYIGGNIGYEIDEPYRGHHYAAKACELLFRQARKHGLTYVLITCIPTNDASARTCELAGGTYLETAEIPEDHDMYERGERQVKVFRFDL
ncbi:MAG: GNAT family N-acetyltransferase [Lachnospiraceae bacterium]|nr:GNAT family N-acetyltransferase [Lachnospiraceae bacterium]